MLFFLTACTSQENGEDKTFNTEKDVQVAPKTDVTVEKPVVTETNKTIEVKPISYAKNIFELVDVNGKKLNVDEAENGIIFQEHRDKVVFLLFFGYRCPPCLAEIPALKEIVKEKGDKLAVIGLEVSTTSRRTTKDFQRL